MIQVVGDLPVYIHIVELVNEDPEKFRLVLPVLGSFHVQMSYMNAIYKHLEGCNIDDLLAEAGLITIGSVNKALKGKDYNRALRLYKLLYESLARLLIENGNDSGIELHDIFKDLINTMKDETIDREDRHLALETLIQADEFQSYLQSLRKEVDQPGNHMAKFILDVMDMIDILFLNINSLRTKTWKSFKDSLRMMMPWIIAYDNTNYRRWLPVFWIPEEFVPLMQ